MNTQALVDAALSHAAAAGNFERVTGSEILTQPGSGLSVAIWAQRIRPIAATSGLAATSAHVQLMVRIYSNALQQPFDAIDPMMMAAVDALMTAYSTDFTLGDLVRQVDLLGAHGDALAATAGWLRHPDGGTSRVFDITLPLIVNDAWTQAP